MYINTLRPRQNGRHFANDPFKCILLNDNVSIPNKISWRFVPKGPIINIPSLVQIMAWRRPGDKPLSLPMMVSSLTHICVTRPQWLKYQSYITHICHRIYRICHSLGWHIWHRSEIYRISVLLRWSHSKNISLQKQAVHGKGINKGNSILIKSHRKVREF